VAQTNILGCTCKKTGVVGNGEPCALWGPALARGTGQRLVVTPLPGVDIGITLNLGVLDRLRDGSSPSSVLKNTDHTNLRVESCEGVVGNLCATAGDGPQKSTLSSIGKANKTHIGEELELELECPGWRKDTARGKTRMTCIRGDEVGVAQPSTSTTSKKHRLLDRVCDIEFKGGKSFESWCALRPSSRFTKQLFGLLDVTVVGLKVGMLDQPPLAGVLPPLDAIQTHGVRFIVELFRLSFTPDFTNNGANRYSHNNVVSTAAMAKVACTVASLATD
jgi:hypothetical protein